MATNKNALIRYRTIDKCLQNRSRRWSLDDLIDACSEALYEYEGKSTYVSKRTVQLDIQTMRSDKLGYNAPIITFEKKYYTYEDEDFSITDIPLTSLDMNILNESMEMLKQFKEFSLFSEMNGVIQKLEDKIYCEANRKNPIIHLDKNENLKGLHHLDVIYQAILKRIVIQVSYRSFKARHDSDIILHPYILKEFNNRWFLIGRKEESDNIMNLALDRIVSIKMNLSIDYDDRDFDAELYYKNTYGVTVLGDKDISEIEFKVDARNAPYIITKPFHHSQEIVEQHEDGAVTFSLRVHHNFEIERLLLGFGASLQILKPRRLRNRIKKIINDSLLNYQ